MHDVRWKRLVSNSSKNYFTFNIYNTHSITALLDNKTDKIEKIGKFFSANRYNKHLNIRG